jgi:hypothetical protein
MRDLGWVKNQGFVAEPRYAEGRLERLPELAAALVRLKVDVLVTMGTPAGVVPNLARPGGNVTGMSLKEPPEHEELLLGIAHRTSFPRSVVQQLNDWLDALRANSRSNGVGPLRR